MGAKEKEEWLLLVVVVKRGSVVVGSDCRLSEERRKAQKWPGEKERRRKKGLHGSWEG